MAKTKPSPRTKARTQSRAKAKPAAKVETGAETDTGGQHQPSFAAHLAEAQVVREAGVAAHAPVAESAVGAETAPATDVAPTTDTLPTMDTAAATTDTAAATETPPTTDTPPASGPVLVPAVRLRSKKTARAPRRGARVLAIPRQQAQRPAELDRTAAAAIASELIDRGVGQAEVERLLVEASAHSSPFGAEGGLHDAVRRALARGIPRAGTLPAGGAAVAFVGAGGAGKTRCTAALATAYRRASTLSVAVLSLGSPEHGRAVKKLLKPERMPVRSAASSDQAARQIARDRSGGLIVVDTAAVAPGDQAAVLALSAELESLALDAVYVAVPATLGAQAARQLLQGLESLRPTGIAITHADETDQLGVAVELAWASGIPVAYVHEGLELASALSAPDPFQLATRLLP